MPFSVSALDAAPDDHGLLRRDASLRTLSTAKASASKRKQAQASASKRKQAQASASKRKLFHGMSDSGHAMLSVVNQATEGESRREIKP
jgi:hypothetical protein